MLLRDHPLMSYRSVRNWPPVLERHGPTRKKITTRGSWNSQEGNAINIQFANRFFLYIDYEGSSYIGCLLFDDKAFCSQIAKLLQGHCGRSLSRNWWFGSLLHRIKASAIWF